MKLKNKGMNILLLSDATSSHTIKWAMSLSENDIKIGIFTLNPYDEFLYEEHSNISVFTGELPKSLSGKTNGDFSKIKYLSVLKQLRKAIMIFQPDIVHAHYATSYGLLGALVGFHPYIVSVWGSDVFDFPRKSFLHKMMLKYNLRKADKILSTSHIMAKETSLYTDKQIEVTPFGIDLKAFFSQAVQSAFSPDDIVVGTVKTLEEKYGIRYLLDAFALLVKRHPDLPLKLLIVGGGSQEEYLRAKVRNLKIDEKTIFTGKIPYTDVVKYHRMLSVSVSVSNSESFGVAVIEAGACEKPVVVSNVGGLPEVVEDGVSGFIVPPRNPEKTAEAIEKLVLDKDLRLRMGKAGRERVGRLFNWEDNVRQMICIYQEILTKSKNKK